jgi:hypothetical protein
MAKFKVGDKVKINAKPVNWVDWPQAMDPYSEFVYVKVDKAGDKGKVNEGAYMLFHGQTLEKI